MASFAAFGRIVEGIEVLDAFEKEERDGETPKRRLEIIEATIRSPVTGRRLKPLPKAFRLSYNQECLYSSESAKKYDCKGSVVASRHRSVWRSSWLSRPFLRTAKQDSSTSTTPAVTSTPPAPKRETVAKPLTPKQIKKKEAALKKELETPWKKWLNEDVTYIITDEERKAFKQLNTDEEREQFVEQFWLRRDPTPDTVENEYKEEHYRRIAYANEHFASGIPGWKTDRGRIYITFGPPDEIDSHPSGGTYERPTAEGGGETTTYPVRRLALSLYRGHRQRHHDRIRRHRP